MMLNKSSTKARKRSGLSRHFYTDRLPQKPTVKEEYNPTFHFWLLGFLCFIILVVMLVTFFHAPHRPDNSKLSSVLNEYLTGKRIYQLDFDSPSDFVEYAVSNATDEHILQKSINAFYGDEHSVIIENNGWHLIREGPRLTKPGLVCPQIGCYITIQLVNIVNDIPRNTKYLYISLSYVTSSEPGMGIAKVFVDAQEMTQIPEKGRKVMVLDGFDKDSKAVTKVVNWKINTKQLKENDELYFHATVVEDESGARQLNKFKILGFTLHLK
eukprot:155973_1